MSKFEQSYTIQTVLTIEENKKEDKNQSGGMGTRGVTRPMMGGEKMKHDDKAKGDDHKKQDGGHDMKMDSMKMSDDMRTKMLHQHHKQTLWVYWTVVLLGFWMVTFPLTFDYSVGTVQPSGGRSLWLTLDQRILFMKWSDILSGLGLIFLGWRSLTPNRPVSVWLACFIGIWLSMPRWCSGPRRRWATSTARWSAH